LLLAGVLGLGFGFWIAMQPQAPATVSGAASRPTIVIAAPPAPSLTAPSASPSAIRASISPSPSPAEREYVVQAGDTLRTIADDEYGDPTMWQKLYQANTDVIGNNPDALQPGMRLRIPAS